MNKTVCSIDASTNSLAFAIFENDDLKSYGKILFEGDTIYQKVGDAARKTLGLFHNFQVDSIVIEHTVFMNSPKTAADLALVQGALLGSAQVYGIEVSGSVSPITWQNYIGNKKLTSGEIYEIKKNNPKKSDSWIKAYAREFRKQRTIKFVNTFYNKNVADNDVADAIAIGHWAVNNWGKLTK